MDKWEEMGVAGCKVLLSHPCQLDRYVLSVCCTQQVSRMKLTGETGRADEAVRMKTLGF